MSQQDTRKNHQEPQAYLKGFASSDSSDRIWRLDKTGRAPTALMSITKVGFARGVFSKEDDAIITDILEPHYQSLIQYIGDSLIVDSSYDIQSDDRQVLESAAHMLLSTSLRCSANRAVDNPYVNVAYKQDLRQNEELLSFLASNSLGRDAERECPSSLKVVRNYLQERTRTKRAWIAETLDPIGKSPYHEEFRERLVNGTWHVMWFPEGRNYITSDNPSMMSVFPVDDGLEFPLLLIMPLTRDLIIRVDVSNRLRPPTLPVEEYQVRALNNLTLSHASRYVYASTEDDLALLDEFSFSSRFDKEVLNEELLAIFDGDVDTLEDFERYRDFLDSNPSSEEINRHVREYVEKESTRVAEVRREINMRHTSDSVKWKAKIMLRDKG